MIQNNKKQLFVFDFDGTLANTSQLTKQAMIDYSLENNMKCPNLEAVCLGYADPYHNDFDWGIDLKDQYYHMDRAFIEMSDKIAAGIYKPKIYNNVEKVLKKIKENDHTIAICTAKEKYAVETILKDNNLLDFVSIMKTQEDVKLRGKRPKPHPDLLQEIIEEVNYSIENVFMIGDTDSDIKIARGCNVKSIALSWGGYQTKETLLSHSPDYLFDDIIDMVQFI